MANKSIDEKEMENVIRDILNPFRDDIDIEYEAWSLTHEEGWHKQIEAEWIKDKNFRIYSCSNCKNTSHIERTTLLSPYCSNCGAKMINSQWVKVEYDYGF